MVTVQVFTDFFQKRLPFGYAAKCSRDSLRLVYLIAPMSLLVVSLHQLSIILSASQFVRIIGFSYRSLFYVLSTNLFALTKQRELQ